MGTNPQVAQATLQKGVLSERVHGRSVNSLGQRREGLLSLAGGDRVWRSEQLIEEEVEDVVGLEGKWNLDRDRCSPWA